MRTVEQPKTGDIQERLLDLEGAAMMQRFLLEVAYTNSFANIEHYDAFMAELMRLSQEADTAAPGVDISPERALEQSVRANVYLERFTKSTRARIASRPRPHADKPSSPG